MVAHLFIQQTRSISLGPATVVTLEEVGSQPNEALTLPGLMSSGRTSVPMNSRQLVGRAIWEK